MKTRKGPIIIFGGTGYYGRQIVKHLLKRPAAVRVLSRDISKGHKILGPDVEIIEGDVTNPETVAKCLEGASAILICLSTITPKLIKRMDAIERVAVLDILNQARKAKISRLVYVSGYEIRDDVLRGLNILPFGAIKLEIEEAIRSSELDWTILGDAPSFDLFFAFLRGNKLAIPGGGEAALPTISPEDVGEITAQAILRDDLGGKRFRLTGPEAISFPEAAARMSSISGRQIKHIKIPLGMIRAAGILALPVTPFVRYIYWSLKLLNNFPTDLADQVPDDHNLLLQTFSYEPGSFDDEVSRRLGMASNTENLN